MKMATVEESLISVKFPGYSNGKSVNCFEEGAGDVSERVALWNIMVVLWSVDRKESKEIE